VLLLAVCYLLSPRRAGPVPPESVRQSNAVPKAVASLRGASEARSQTGTAGSSISAPPTSSADTTVQLVLETHGPCCAPAAADGRRIAYRLMAAGERSTCGANVELVVRVGDPSALVFSINGQPGRTLGQPGHPVTVRIAPDSFAELLERSAR